MEIKVEPYKSLTIQEILDQSYHQIIEAAVISGNALKYCNGYLFAITGFNPSEVMKDDEAIGIYKFQIVAFAKTDKKYQPTIKHEKSNTDIPVMDYSPVVFYQELVEFCVDYLNKQVDNTKK